MADQQVHSFCRICTGFCGVVVDIDAGGRISSVRGDKGNPLTRGFACLKGIEAPAFQYHPDRLLQPQARQPDGSFRPIPVEDALNEIADKVDRLIQRHGPNAIAAFRGTQSYYDSVGFHMLPAWMAAIGSRSSFSTFTIDQSAKWVTKERLGSWAGGYHSFSDADVWMLVGLNPVVSLWGGNGGPMFDPVKQIKQARDRGMTLIVIDPRFSDTARLADIFMQPIPGEDVAIAAGLLHLILGNGWHDAAFCDQHVTGMAELRSAVAPFTPAYVAARAGVEEQSLHDIARAFAHNARRGICAVGTGPSMAQHSNLADHFYECLNVVCGRYLRAGDAVPNPGVTTPRGESRAQVVPPQRPWESSPKGCTGRGMIFGEMMSGTLADEILLPGTDQIRALFSVGANPASALPDQTKAMKALDALDLLVTIDPMMTATAKQSHYVFAPLLQFERCDVPMQFAEKRAFPVPYVQYTPALVSPPQDAEIVDDWYVFWGLAKRLNLELSYCGAPLDMTKAPSREALMEQMLRPAAVPIQTIQAQRRGAVLDVPPQTILPAEDGPHTRFEVAPVDVVAELRAVLQSQENRTIPSEFSHLLISRRMREVSNTQGHDLPKISERVPYNPAWLNPADMAALDIVEGSRVTIRSSTGSIIGIAKRDETVRTGVISMTHGWGAGQDAGSSTSLLISTDSEVEAINAMPRMSAIPVNIARS